MLSSQVDGQVQTAMGLSSVSESDMLNAGALEVRARQNPIPSERAEEKSSDLMEGWRVAIVVLLAPGQLYIYRDMSEEPVCVSLRESRVYLVDPFTM